MQNKIGKLYIIATPIGNLSDITLRALETLKFVDLILSEDTRVTKILLNHYSIEKPLQSYHDHSDEMIEDKIINMLQQGTNIALVSDAGTPLISDPGYKLVKKLKSLSIPMITIPGPCSLIAALTVAGLPTDRFMFIGFLPNKNSAKEKLFLELQLLASTLVAFETANRLLDSLTLIAEYFPKREIAVVREISKIYEESVNGSALEVKQYYQDHQDKLRGEIVLLIAPPSKDSLPLDTEIITNLSVLMKEMSLRDAVQIMAEQYPNIGRKNIYKIALKIK